jgi:nucleotide-binding universal stress UspA family protein
VPVGEFREFISDYEAMFAEAARAHVKEGITLAHDAGLDASREPVESGGSVARARGGGGAARRRGHRRGPRGRGGVASALLGSVSSGLEHNAPTPTLIIPD